jgi:hypothetical protein
LACHLQIDADPVPDPAYHFDADQDSDFYLMRMLIRIRMRIKIHNTDLLNRCCSSFSMPSPSSIRYYLSFLQFLEISFSASGSFNSEKIHYWIFPLDEGVLLLNFM